MSEQMRKTAQQMKDEYDAKIDEWASKTPEWARSQGCYRPEEGVEPDTFFLVTPRNKKNAHKPN